MSLPKKSAKCKIRQQDGERDKKFIRYRKQNGNISPFLPIINLYVNRLNVPIKRHIGWMDKKQEPTNMLSTETCYRSKDTHRLKAKGWKKYSMQTGT